MDQQLRFALERAVNRSGAPGAVACLGNGPNIHFLGAAGNRQRSPEPLPATPDTLYDLASLTKVMATATAVMQLRDAGRVDLDAKASDYLPLQGLERFTIRQLLTHTTGLAPLIRFHPGPTPLNDAVARIATAPITSMPGTRRIYSDLGYILLGKLVELWAGDTLDAYCQERIFKPAGMTRTAYNPPREWWGNTAPTENDPTRGGMLVGRVHDENAFALGGVAGHAGLFAPAQDVARFCHALIEGRLLSLSTLDEMLETTHVPSYPWQGLGWKTDPWRDSAEGWLAGRRVFGHTGWTGVCMWVDRDNGDYLILLSNTCHPSRSLRDNRSLRQAFSSGAHRAWRPTRANTHTGLDRLAWNGFSVVRGKNLGLLTNTAVTDVFGRNIVEVLGTADSHTLRRLFSPEHGFSLEAAAGELVASQSGPIPIVSLYGDKQTPDRADLQGLDQLLVCLPDIGARYYTYIATMKNCLEVCAAAGVPVLVLDRPNPLGSRVLEGPVATRTTSLVSWGAVPVRHGMTLGEAAMFFKETEPWGNRLNLDILPMDQWPNDFLFPQCELPWRAPSPNIPDFETSLAYVGTCLFEGLNVNEGRGTDAPFLQFGAPWLDAHHLVAEIAREGFPGCSLEEVAYTPRSLPGRAPNPEYQDQVCFGVRFRITDPHAFRPFHATVALIAGMLKRHPDECRFKSFFDTLAGGTWLRQQLEAGKEAADIDAEIAEDLARFDATRPKLYESFQEMVREHLDT